MINNTELGRLEDTYIGDQSFVRLGNNIPPYMSHSIKQDANFFFGTAFGNATAHNIEIRYIGKPQEVDGHVLVVGSAGSGKSSCIAIPTLDSWNGTIFAIDIKGELLEKGGQALKSKHPVKNFEFTTEKGNTSGYDPFYLLREGAQNDLVQNAREIAQAIIPIPPNIQEPFWSLAAQNVLTAVILYVYGSKETDKDSGEILEGTFNQAMKLIQNQPIWELINEIGKSKNEAAKMHINQFIGIENPDDNKMLASISAELSNRVMVFATDNRIKSSFNKNKNADMMKWEDLETHSIFMRIPEDKLGQWDGAITLMLTQLIRTLERRPDKYSAEGKRKNLPPVLLLLDEFPRLGKIDVILNAISTLRSKGVTICLMMQSLAQLDKTYGKESRRIIIDNCKYKAILNVNDPESQKTFSDMIGSINVKKMSTSDNASISISTSSGSNTTDVANYSDRNSKGISRSLATGKSGIREPIIHPHELATLKDILLVTPEGFCRVFKTPYYGRFPKSIKIGDY